MTMSTALELFASDVTSITYEFENVPAAAADDARGAGPVLPDRQSAGNRRRTGWPKRISSHALGIATAAYRRRIDRPQTLRAAIATLGAARAC